MLEIKSSKIRDKTFYTIIIGGSTADCGLIGFDNKSNIAHISYFEYKSICALNGELPQKYGTIHLLKATIEFIKRTYPWIEFIELDDMSEIPCINNAGIKRKLVLHCYNLAIYGETWYEREFGAILKDPTARIDYDIVKAKLIDPLFKKPWNDKMGIPIELKPLYESSDTIRDFFLKIRNTFERNTRCRLLSGWIEPFIKSLFTSKLVYNWVKWIIPIKDKKENKENSKNKIYYPINIANITNNYSKLKKTGGKSTKRKK